MNMKWVLTNFILLEVAQPDVAQTTVEMLQSDWAATIVAAKTNPDIGLKPYSQGRSGSAQLCVCVCLSVCLSVCLCVCLFQL